MRFAFTDDQLGFRGSLRDMLAKECPASAVRGCWSNETGRVPGLWKQLGDLGLLGINGPEEHGGLGLGAADLVLPLEEAGRAALPEPLLEHAAVAVPLLARFAPDSVQREWLPPALAGDATITVALDDAPFVPNADSADLLVTFRSGALWAVPRSATTRTRLESVDGARRLFRVDWAEADGVRLAIGASAASAREEACAFGALGASAELVGLAAHILDLTVGYVKVREQFGKPIGSFQAIKHHLANALTAIEMARPLVHRAAASVAADSPDRALDASIAKARASVVSQQVAKLALQCHGAIGYSTEYDLHLWMKRIWALAAAWGDAGFHRARIAAVVLDGSREVYP